MANGVTVTYIPTYSMIVHCPLIIIYSTQISTTFLEVDFLVVSVELDDQLLLCNYAVKSITSTKYNNVAR